MTASAIQDRPVRIGIIGCGQIARYHLDNYAKLSRQEVEVVALADISESCVAEAGKLHNVPTIHQFTDFRELLERDDIDAVDVCLHNNLHRPATEAALRAGKHVYCEKPMAGSYTDAAAMMQTARETKRLLCIQLATLFYDQTRAAKELIDAGALGELYFARSVGYRRRGRPYVDGYGTPRFVQKDQAAGGALYDMGVYHIARMLYLLGNPKPVRVSGKTYQKTGMDPKRREISGYDVEELGMGFVRFANTDTTLDIIEAWAIHLDEFEGSYVAGTEGGVRLDPFGYFRSIGDLDISGTTDLESARLRWIRVRQDHDLYSSPQAHWIAGLRGKVELLPTAELALNTMLISEAIYLSDKLGREVTTEEVIAQSKSSAAKI